MLLYKNSSACYTYMTNRLRIKKSVAKLFFSGDRTDLLSSTLYKSIDRNVTKKCLFVNVTVTVYFEKFF